MNIRPLYTSHLFVILLGGFLLGLSACGQEERVEIARAAKEVRNLTEAHTRVVWAQDTTELTDVFARGNELRLMGYDSDDGKGARVILPGPANFSKPMITRRGDRIVYSDVEHGTVHVVNWNGKRQRQITEGMALAVWIDPGTGTEWIYVGRDRTEDRGYPYRSLIRLPIDELDREEWVWDRTLVGTDSFQLSADGTRASGVFPWPNCGVADLTTHSLTRYGRGCWTSFAPDNSYLFWYFDGAHRNALMVNDRTEERWRVSVNTAPDMEGYEVYHPRWSNHPRFITVTGPYKIRVGGNNIRGGGPDVEIYIGRFSEDYKSIEKWVRVTQNPYANFFPDVWINPADKPLPVTAKTKTTPSAMLDPDELLDWPVLHDDLLFIWKNRNADNEIVADDGTLKQCVAEPVGHARFGRHFDMDVRNGYFVAPEAGRVLYEAMQHNKAFSIELVMTPTKEQDKQGAVFTWGDDPKNRNMALTVSDDTILLEWKGIREPDRVFKPRLANLTSQEPHHLLLSVTDTHLSFYVNGDETASIPLEPFHFHTWTPQPLHFGGRPDGRRNWSGHIEGVAIYGRALTDEEARLKTDAYARILSERVAPETTTVKARLTHASQIPTPEAIEPYRRGLIANEYEVLEVLKGELEDAEILVAHWIILDGQTLDTAAREAGSVHTMTIELYDDRPELEGERLSMDTDNLLLRTFFDTGS